MRDYENPTHVPRLPLKIIASAYVLWFVVVPSVVLIRTQPILDLPLTIMEGLTLTGIALGFLFIHRLILWFYYTFFWYILAALAVGSALCAGTVAVGILKLPAITSPVPIAISADLQPLIFIPGAILGVVGLILVFRPGSRPAAPTPPAPAPLPTPKPVAPPIDHAAAIRERRKKLGLDK
jgi:hypothetical protein